MVNKSGNDVFRFFKCVMLRALRLFAILWQLHVPRVCFLPVSTLNRFTEHRTSKPTNMFQCVLDLRRFKAGEKPPCIIRLVSLKREFCKVSFQMLIPDLLEAPNGRRLHALALVLMLAVWEVVLFPEIQDAHILLRLALRLGSVDACHDFVSYGEKGLRRLAFYRAMFRSRLALWVMLLTVYRAQSLRLVD